MELRAKIRKSKVIYLFILIKFEVKKKNYE